MQALLRRAQIQADGTITVPVEKAEEGTTVEVIILLPDAADPVAELLGAASSSMEFWDNPIDDSIWNNA